MCCLNVFECGWQLVVFVVVGVVGVVVVVVVVCFGAVVIGVGVVVIVRVFLHVFEIV